ncbi:uncharacterized protein F54H12.2-like [Diachasmimorpha longicaudata]|uniref:uncharacterized protein F54H12.2-like n=1 Tax=Diachasmimorpha longicaudata TaxID=58733 RepID=UPI0030B87153
MIKVRARILKTRWRCCSRRLCWSFVTPPNNLYAYRAYIETLLNYGTDSKSPWATNSYGAMDSTAVAVGDARTNNGLAARQAFPKELRVRLMRAKDYYCVMDDSVLNFKVHIEEASLIVCRVKLSPGLSIAHAKTLAKTTAKYPLTRVEVKSFVLHRRIMGETIDNAILGQLPKRIILGFVENSSFNGSRKKDPFNLQYFGINFLWLNVDGRQVPTKPLQRSSTSGVCLDVEAFNALFAVRFNGATEQNVNCLLYAEYDNLLAIDSTRQVIVDYSG